MPGTFFGLEIGRRGLQTHRGALDVTSHNLTNASTEGYSRQEAVITATDPYTIPDVNSSVTPGQLGTGIKTSMLRRIRDEYMDPQVRRSNTDRYYWEDQTSIFSRVEVCFAEPASSGIQDQVVEFFKGWQNLNNNPQDPGVKASVKELGVQLASLMTYTYNQLTDIQESVIKPGVVPAVDRGQLKDQVDRVNDLLVQVRNLTTDIEKIYQIGQQPNDLLDKRDLLLDELAHYGPLEVVQETVNGKPTGDLSTFTFFGMDVKAAPSVEPTFFLQINAFSGNVELHENYTSGMLVDLTANCNDTNEGGSLLGLEKSRQDILNFKDTLNDMSIFLRDEIRNQNNTPPPAATLDFFTAGSSLATGDFSVNGAVVSDPNIIDGTKAGVIADVRKEDMSVIAALAGRDYTLEECYGLLTTDVGNKAKGADDMAANQKAIQEQMSKLRESVSGVSVDEELTKMVQFQYGYQASARVVSMIDELLDVLINRTAY